MTPDRQRVCIDHLASIGLVGAAAKTVGMSPKSAYALRRSPDAESFAAAWDDAVRSGGDRAYDTAIERALSGSTVPIFYRGRQIGEHQVYNDRLVVTALNTHDAPAPG